MKLKSVTSGREKSPALALWWLCEEVGRACMPPSPNLQYPTKLSGFTLKYTV